MDGLLLDTEPLWGQAMTRVAAQHGIEMTPQRFKATTGLRIYEVCDHWALHYPWSGPATARAVADEILEDVISLSLKEGRVLPGALALLKALREGGYKIGLASSSPLHMIEALLHHFQIHSAFDCITSADAVDFGKPHPAVFLHCASLLNSKPYECLVLEDSVNGVIAGKAALMKVIAIPDALHFDDPRFAIADEKWNSLEQIDIKSW